MQDVYSYQHLLSRVPHPFRGDYVRLRQNVKWKKLSSDTNDQYVVFADIMPKINRASGRVSSNCSMKSVLLKGTQGQVFAVLWVPES